MSTDNDNGAEMTTAKRGRPPAKRVRKNYQADAQELANRVEMALKLLRRSVAAQPPDQRADQLVVVAIDVLAGE